MLTEGWDANTVTHILGFGRSEASYYASRWSGGGFHRGAAPPPAPGQRQQLVVQLPDLPPRSGPVQAGARRLDPGEVRILPSIGRPMLLR
jgi:hypothetical protein